MAIVKSLIRVRDAFLQIRSCMKQMGEAAGIPVSSVSLHFLKIIGHEYAQEIRSKCMHKLTCVRTNFIFLLDNDGYNFEWKGMFFQ